MFNKIINKSEKVPEEIRPALCLDLDGTIRYSKSSKYIQNPADIALFEGVEEKIWEYRNQGFLIFGVTNQGGVAFNYKSPERNLAEIAFTRALFTKDPFHSIKYCYQMETGDVFPYNYRTLLRKPSIGMLALLEVEAWNEGYIIDWDKSIFVGDNDVDEGCAVNAGIRFEWAKDFFNLK
jgi:D-glycero-D-manno-heptose 1,7-bisphosphate phosphatase